MIKKDLDKTFYLIAKYWLGQLQGFIKIGDNKEEIMKLFEERYMWKPNTFGITEASRKTGITITSISYSANGKRKTAGGFIWHFV